MPYIVYAVLVCAAGSLAWAFGRQERRPPVDGSPLPSFFLLLIVLLFAAIAIPAMLVFSTGRGTPYGDFDKAYLAAGRVAFSAPQLMFACANGDGLCFVNLPIVALLFAPLAGLSLPAAHRWFDVIGILALLLAIARLWSLTGATRRQRLVIVLLVLLNGPLFYSLRLGNLTHVVLLFMVLAAGWLVCDRDGRAGAILGLAAVLKPPFLIWLPYLVFRRRWTAVLSMSATIAALVLTSIVWFGWPLNAYWLERYVVMTGSNPLGAYNVQSIAGMLVRLKTYGTLVSWLPVPVGATFRLVQLLLLASVTAMAAAAFVLGTVPRLPSDRARLFTDIGILLCAMLVLSPISWTHYYCLLLLPLAAGVTRQLDVPRGRLFDLALVVTGGLVSLPVALWIPSQPPFNALVARLLISHYVFGALSLLLLLLWGRLDRYRAGTAIARLPFVHHLTSPRPASSRHR